MAGASRNTDGRYSPLSEKPRRRERVEMTSNGGFGTSRGENEGFRGGDWSTMVSAGSRRARRVADGVASAWTVPWKKGIPRERRYHGESVKNTILAPEPRRHLPELERLELSLGRGLGHRHPVNRDPASVPKVRTDRLEHGKVAPLEEAEHFLQHVVVELQEHASLLVVLSLPRQRVLASGARTARHRCRLLRVGRHLRRAIRQRRPRGAVHESHVGACLAEGEVPRSSHEREKKTGNEVSSFNSRRFHGSRTKKIFPGKFLGRPISATYPIRDVARSGARKNHVFGQKVDRYSCRRPR